eukprot:Colp12_sorted_trinity150504_noHs@31775
MCPKASERNGGNILQSSLAIGNLVVLARLALSLLHSTLVLEVLQVLRQRLRQVDVTSVVLTQPGVLQYLVGRQPLVRVDNKKLRNKIFGRVRNGVPVRGVELKAALHNLLEKNSIVLIVEGRIPAQQNIGNHTNRPHVDGLAVTLLTKNLRCNIVGCTTSCVQDMLVVHELGETKVGNHHIRGLVLSSKQNVLGLQISMHDVVAVEVANGLRHLSNNSNGIFLSERALMNDAVEKLTTINILKDKVELVGGVKFLKKANDVLVVNLPHNSNFRLNHSLLALAKFLIDNLNRESLTGLSLGCKLHHGKATGSELLAHFVDLFHVILPVAGNVLLKLLHFADGCSVK